MLDRFIAATAGTQLGLITRAQVLSVGTPRQLDVRLGRGRLALVRTGVFRIAGTPETWEQHLLAACLGGGSGAVASFRCAASLWGLDHEYPDQLEITVPRDRRARLPGVVVHTSLVLGRRHATRFQSLPVTTPARTLCDLTAYWGLRRVEVAVDDALRRRLTTLRALRTIFLDLATKGRHRSTVMRAILDDRLLGVEPGESEQEAKLARWLVASGLPIPVHQHRVRIGRRTFRLDLAYPACKLGIEYDGWDTHSRRTAFDTDRARDDDLEDAGWRVMHFTSRSTRQEVVRRVGRALAARSM